MDGWNKEGKNTFILLTHVSLVSTPKKLILAAAEAALVRIAVLDGIPLVVFAFDLCGGDRTKI